MVKQVNKGTGTAPTATVPTTTAQAVVIGQNNAQAAVVLAAATPATAQGTITVLKTGMPYRGARAAWYSVLCQYNGQPYAAFLAHVQANRPSVYGPKSRHAGQPEPIPGWVGFFTRNGIVAITP
jgi:hypothetical protein